jgi:hypothetical protein
VDSVSPALLHGHPAMLQQYGHQGHLAAKTGRQVHAGLRAACKTVTWECQQPGNAGGIKLGRLHASGCKGQRTLALLSSAEPSPRDRSGRIPGPNMFEADV